MDVFFPSSLNDPYGFRCSSYCFKLSVFARTLHDPSTKQNKRKKICLILILNNGKKLKLKFLNCFLLLLFVSSSIATKHLYTSSIHLIRQNEKKFTYIVISNERVPKKNKKIFDRLIE